MIYGPFYPVYSVNHDVTYLPYLILPNCKGHPRTELLPKFSTHPCLRGIFRFCKCDGDPRANRRPAAGVLDKLPDASDPLTRLRYCLGEQHRRYGKAQGLGGLQVDSQIELSPAAGSASPSCRTVALAKDRPVALLMPRRFGPGAL